jgi:sulfate adenylyltransferase subunit 1 (EFTu-like GTPase family)|tara:strand:- start:7242 stop:7916 length:675 start_codon:yes stop_codon:yes gene_type:complete
MKNQLLVGVSILGLSVLGACSHNEPKPLVETPEVKYKTEKVKAAVSIVPDWYEKMPEKDGSIFTVGSATAPDLQFAVDIATLNAKVVLADRINGKLKAMTKSWMTKLGQTDVDATVMTEIEKVAKNVIANVDVSGYNPVELKVFPAGTQYRAFVLLEYSDKEAAKIIMNRLRKDRMVYSRLRSTKAWKELENEVEKSEKKDEAESLKNLENLIDDNSSKKEPTA